MHLFHPPSESYHRSRNWYHLDLQKLISLAIERVPWRELNAPMVDMSNVTVPTPSGASTSIVNGSKSPITSGVAAAVSGALCCNDNPAGDGRPSGVGAWLTERRAGSDVPFSVPSVDGAAEGSTTPASSASCKFSSASTSPSCSSGRGASGTSASSSSSSLNC